MKPCVIKVQRIYLLLVSSLFIFMFSGCATVGPRSISMGRADYNEAINRTEDEQMLLAIVKGRYSETSSLLAVSGVAANFRFKTNAGIDVGYGPSQNYDGNLVPFTGGMAYEENPTITYAPIVGQKYVRQMMSPIPLDILFMSLRSSISVKEILTLLVSRVNSLKNPDFLYASQNDAELPFKRFVVRFEELHRASILHLVGDPRQGVAFDIVVENNAPQYHDKVNEFFSLLKLPLPDHGDEDIVIPVYFAIKTGGTWGMAITTRSTFDLIEILTAAIDVPQEHIEKNLVTIYPPIGLPGQDVRIISSPEKPKGMPLSVKYRGYWFYIDETDHDTKAFFRALRTFWSLGIAGTSDLKSGPVFTIPVSQ